MITRIINYRNGSAPHRFFHNFRRRYRSDRKALNLHLQPDWQRVLGQLVEVRRNGKLIRVGTVDNVMPDNSILWISASGTDHRVMVERAGGYEVYARYPWDPPPLEVPQ